jgi:hypothetical protein
LPKNLKLEDIEDSLPANRFLEVLKGSVSTYKTGFEAGKTGDLNAADIADNCNDVHAPQDNQTSCVNGYVAGYDITCHIGIAKVRYGSCPEIIYNSIHNTIMR